MPTDSTVNQREVVDNSRMVALGTSIAFAEILDGLDSMRMLDEAFLGDAITLRTARAFIKHVLAYRDLRDAEVEDIRRRLGT